jgi:hypothetical protein
MLNKAGDCMIPANGGSCEHGNEPSSSIEGREYLEYLDDY